MPKRREVYTEPKTVFCRTLAVVLTSWLLVSPIATQGFSKNKTFSAVSTPITHAGYSTVQRDRPRRRARTFDVIHYTIRTSFDVPNKTVMGEVDVTLKPLSSGFTTLELDAANMRLEQVSLSSGIVLRAAIRTEILRVELDRAYKPSETITVKIKYRTRPQRGLHFISRSREEGFRRPAQIWTQGEPEDNHHWFPCYDFPDDKATSEQYITTGQNELAIANGVLIDTTDNANGSRTFHWQMGQPHSSYLISLIVGDYAKLTDTYKTIPVEYYTYRGAELQARRAFGMTPTMMRWFSSVLDYEFPYDRYAQTVVGEFIFGGMENITSTTLADTEILNGGDTIDLVSHELAHSWFGNLVTCKDWAHLWLNEGMATFLEAAFREQLEGRESYLAIMRKNAKIYFAEDPSSKHHPLVNPNYPLSMELFDATTYKKGAFVIHMLRETVGDEPFWEALNVYLNEYKFRSVDSRDFQRVFEKVSGQSLDWFFDQWVYKAGYPEVRVRTRYSSALRQLTLNVSQLQKPDGITPAVFRLFVDIEIVTASGPKTERIEVNRRTQDFVFKLDGRPKRITFDKGARVLKKLSIDQVRALDASVIIDGADPIAQREYAKRPSLLSQLPSITPHLMILNSFPPNAY